MGIIAHKAINSDTAIEDIDPRLDSIRSWWIGAAALVVITIAFGAPYVSVVALKKIAVELGGGARSAPALAYALSSAGAAVGGLAFGWLADRVGILWPLIVGTVMLCAGSVLSGLGGELSFFIGHGVMIGLFEIAAVYSPLVTYVSKWFYRHRGVALSLVASGQQVAGAVWPPVFGVAIDRVGWHMTLFGFGIVSLIVISPMIWFLRHPAPPAEHIGRPGSVPLLQDEIFHNVFFNVMCAASVCCCMAMAMPIGHLVALCGDLGYSQAHGANMLSLLLGCGFVSRLLWGRLANSIGGLQVIFLGVICQAATFSLFLFTVNLTSLYVVSAAFGLGFGGIIPGYVLAVRELCPANQAGWRIATILFFSLTGMAIGGWLSGYMFDLTLDYRNSFTLGIAFNAVAIFLIGGLVFWRHMMFAAREPGSHKTRVFGR